MIMTLNDDHPVNWPALMRLRLSLSLSLSLCVCVCVCVCLKAVNSVGVSCVMPVSVRFSCPVHSSSLTQWLIVLTLKLPDLSRRRVVLPSPPRSSCSSHPSRSAPLPPSFWTNCPTQSIDHAVGRSVGRRCLSRNRCQIQLAADHPPSGSLSLAASSQTLPAPPPPTENSIHFCRHSRRSSVLLLDENINDNF